MGFRLALSVSATNVSWIGWLLSTPLGSGIDYIVWQRMDRRQFSNSPKILAPILALDQASLVYPSSQLLQFRVLGFGLPELGCRGLSRRRYRLVGLQLIAFSAGNPRLLRLLLKRSVIKHKFTGAQSDARTSSL
jgi:hypothetical protein